MSFITIQKFELIWEGRGKYKTSTGYDFSIVGYPTHNCQWSAVSQAEGLLYSSECLEILKQIKKDSNLDNQLLFDIHNTEMLTSKMNELFKDKIVFKQPYISTNGSNMIMYLINIRNL